MNSPNTPESIVLYTPAIPCSGTAGILALLLPSPAHAGNGKAVMSNLAVCDCFPRARGKWFGFTCITVAGNCFPRARRNMGKAREATPEKQSPTCPARRNVPILFGWARLSHAGRMMPPPPYSRTGPPRASGAARYPNRRPHWTGRYLLPFYRFGVTLLPIFGARTHAEGSPFHSEVHLCAGVNGTSPL